MSLQDISNVSISLQTGGIQRDGFGTPIFLSFHNFFFGRTASFGRDGYQTTFTTDSAAYKALQNFFSQNPSVSQVKVGRMNCNSNFSPNILGSGGSLVVGRTVSITVTDADGNNVTASYTTQTGDTATDVVLSLVTDINAASLTGVTLTNNGDDFDIEGAGLFTTTSISNLNFAPTTGSVSTGASFVSEYNTLQDDDDQFYAVAMEPRDDDTILAMDAAVGAEERIFITSTADTDAITDSNTETATDILAQLYREGSNRTIGYWHQDSATDYPECAFLGYNLPFPAGKITWGNIQVNIPSARNPTTGLLLNATHKNNLAARNANFQDERGGVGHNREGKMIGGEWIDVIRGRDNLAADLYADVFDLLTNQQGSKVQYTNPGIASVVGVMRQRLTYYRDVRNFLTGDITINAPRAEDVLRSDKVARVLQDVTFEVQLAGAIHVVTIFGTLVP